MPIDFKVKPAVTPNAGEPANPVVVEVRYDCELPPDAGGTTELVQQTARLVLDAALNGEVRLEGAIRGPVEASVLGLDGSSRIRRVVPAAHGVAEWVLTAQEVALLADGGQQLPGGAAARLVTRKARLFSIGLAAVDFSQATALAAPVAGGADWQQAGLQRVFNGEASQAMAVGLAGLDLAGLAVLDWKPAHVAIDGVVTARLPQRPAAGWLLQVNGSANVLCFIPDDLSAPSPRAFSLAIPETAIVTGPRTAPDEGGHPHGQRVPADFTETEAADNPAIFTEDPGSFCRPFSNPERVLSERSFFCIARVTQPDIGPLASARTKTLALLELDGDIAGYPSALPPRRTRFFSSGMTGAVRLAGAMLPNRIALPERYLDMLRRLPQGRTAMDGDHPLQWEDDIAQYQSCTVALGHILEFRMRWRSNGYSLGTVASTLTLAPRQTKRIQKIEWSRRERARRAERTQQTDSVADSTQRERDYQDSVAANLHEWSFGFSHADVAGAAGGIGFFASGVLGGVGGGAGMANSASYQEGGRSTSASEQQRLRDAIRRHGDSLRRFESTVVSEVEQEESVTGTTEVIRNPNYAHSLTVIYYQILRHLKVSTEFAGVRECLFVPFAIKPFDIQRAYRWREAIQAGIRSARYGRALAFLKDVHENFAYSDVPAGPRAAQSLRFLRGSIYLSLGIERPRDGADGQFDPDSWAVAQPMLGLPAYGIFAALNSVSNAQRDHQYQSDHAPDIAARWANRLALKIGNRVVQADCTLATRYRFNSAVRIDFTVPVEELNGLSRQQATRLEVRPQLSLPKGSVANLTRLSVIYNTDRYERTVQGRTGVNDLVSVSTGNPETATVNLPLDAWELVDERAEMRRSVGDLTEHLNEHVEYYHKAIWWRMDRDRLLMLLDGFYVPGTNNVSIASVVDREPLGIIGNSLVYRVGAASFLGLGKIASPGALYNAYAPNEPVSDPMFISLPTEGLYAQTIMDECPALEEHFGNGDWVLQDKEPDLGTIAPDLMQSRRADPSQTVQPSTMPATIINLQNAPDAPAPNGVQGILQALTKGDSFRDMAGLAGTQANARAALETAAGLATSFGQGAASLASAELASKIHATNTADQKLASIKRAESLKLIEPAEASIQAGEVLREMHTPRQQVKPHQEQPIIAAIDSARSVEGSVIEAHTSDGLVRVALGGDNAQGSPGIRQGEIVRNGAGLMVVKLILANFDVARSDLKPEHKQALDDLAELGRSSRLTDSRFRVVSIVGHASTTGAEQATPGFQGNVALSKARAAATLAYLRDRRVLSSTELRGNLAGLGSRDPVVETGDNIEEPMNRSVELTFSLFDAGRAALEPGDCTLWQINTDVSFAGADKDIGKRARRPNFTGGFKIGGKFDIGELSCVETGETRKITLFSGYASLGAGLELLPEGLSEEMKTFIKVVILDRLNMSGSVASLSDRSGVFQTHKPVGFDWFENRPVLLFQTSAAPLVAGVEETLIAFFDPEAPGFVGGLAFMPSVVLAPMAFEVSTAVQLGVIHFN